MILSGNLITYVHPVPTRRFNEKEKKSYIEIKDKLTILQTFIIAIRWEVYLDLMLMESTMKLRFDSVL